MKKWLSFRFTATWDQDFPTKKAAFSHQDGPSIRRSHATRPREDEFRRPHGFHGFLFKRSEFPGRIEHEPLPAQEDW